MNSVVLIGRLARDPELSYTPSTQTAVCHFTLAVDRPRRNGEERGADFLRITVFGRQAENCDRYLSKGRQAAVHGRIETGSYKNREGVTVYTTDIIADNVEFLGNGQGGQNQGGSYGNNGGYSNQGGSYGGGYGQGGNNGYNNAGGRGGNDFGGQDTGFGGQETGFGGFDELPDTFQAAEDDIPF
jgi:single-strand DNA-binding protein